MPSSTISFSLDNEYPWIISKSYRKGLPLDSMGKTHEENMYSGSCIFVDHAKRYIHIEHLINFTTNETILAKQHFEKHMFDMGITIQAYQSDNGIFAACGFLDEIKCRLQNIRFSGVGAHHQNGIAEQAIQTILTKSHTIMIHAVLHWTDMADPSLWPMVVHYCAYHHNHYPALLLE